MIAAGMRLLTMIFAVVGFAAADRQWNYPRLEGEGFQEGSTSSWLYRFSFFSRYSCASRNPGVPVKAGIQFLMVPSLRRDKAWIPVFTGMTTLMLYCSDAHGRPHCNSLKDISLKGRPFLKFSLRLKARDFQHPRRGDKSKKGGRFAPPKTFKNRTDLFWIGGRITFWAW